MTTYKHCRFCKHYQPSEELAGLGFCMHPEAAMWNDELFLYWLVDGVTDVLPEGVKHKTAQVMRRNECGVVARLFEPKEVS